MKRKYFLFRKEDLSLLSSSSSDTGKGLSVFGVSADSMSYVTAIKGGVVLYFNNATPYEENNLTDGESFEKTTVTVNCEEGKEVDLIESIMNFLGSDNSPNIMRFDSLYSGSSLKEVRTSVTIGASVKANPVNRVTRLSSLQRDNGFTASTSSVVNDIDFFIDDYKPILDLEAENATYDASSPYSITALANSGTGGSTYDVDVSSSVGTITKTTASSSLGIVKDCTNVGTNEYLVLSNTLTVKDDYVLYIVYASTAGAVGSIYGSASGQTVGLAVEDESLVNPAVSINTFGVRHEGRKSAPAISRTNNVQNGTVEYRFPANDIVGFQSTDPEYQLCYVFVIRRDADGNMYMYNHKGDVVAIIDKSEDNILSSIGTLPGDTSGDLVIDQIGSAGGNNTSSFKGDIARFGVISTDIGDERCRNLATQLFNLYEF